ncbi:ABC transporter permease [Paraburkholderia sp. BCC1885]|uniref:MlaE family ABC transporter permease n=1 Tax=Paraburkholderia sp. BCC1885 TaxID=2562669 RepID=UPI001C9257A2
MAYVSVHASDGTTLDGFGASVYTIDLVRFSFLREFGILRASSLLAGRTVSALTAQIGSMKINEKVDAIRAPGLNPVELLLLPRASAMVFALPALTLGPMMSGPVGSPLVCMPPPRHFADYVRESPAPRYSRIAFLHRHR